MTHSHAGQDNRHHRHHAFHPSTAGFLDDPSREDWQKPDLVTQQLALHPDSVVADIGCGTGYFTIRLFPLVPRGRVLAVDAERSMVEATEARLKAAGAANVTGVVAEAGALELPSAVDAALVVDVYHHVDDRAGFLKRLRERVRPGGRVLILEHRPDPSIPGPPMDMRLAPERVLEEFRGAGFELETRDELILPRQYALLFAAPTVPERNGLCLP